MCWQLTGLRTRPDLLFGREWKSPMPKFDRVWKFQRKSKKKKSSLTEWWSRQREKWRRESIWKGCKGGEMNKDRERGGGIGLICRKVKLHCGISAPSTSKPPPWRIYSLSSFCYFNFKLRILCVSCVCGYRESLRKNFTPLCALTNEHLHVS